MKVYLVTGSSRGIGSKIVEKIINANKDNFVVGISRKKSKFICNLEKNKKDQYKHIVYDLEDLENLNKIFSEVKDIGHVYCFINNAAYAYDDLITNAKIDKLEKMFKINVLSPIILTKFCIRSMILNKVIEGSNIIHISSVSTQTGYKGLGMYASTKSALEGFSKNTAREWGPVGIRSNIVAPGFVLTDMSNSIPEDSKEKIFKRNSMQREISIDTIAETVYFLSLAKSKSITGQIIRVDNGTV